MQKPARLLPSVDRRFRLSVTYRSIAELKPDPANPRRHSKKQIRQIKNSIETFGFIVPVSSIVTATSSPVTVGCSPVASSAGLRCRHCVSTT